MIDFEKETDSFIEKLKQTEIYSTYIQKEQEILEYPDLKKGIDEFRERNFNLQNEADSNTLFDEIDRFHREYEQFCSNPIVNSYIDAEVAYCRMVQQVNERILLAFANQMN